MIYQLKITSPENKKFLLEVELDSEETFYALHTIIKNFIGNESHQLSSFFLTDKQGLKQKEISLLDIGTHSTLYHIMQTTKLSDLINSKETNFIYTFDFINDRSLHIELTEIVMEKNLNEPLIEMKQGDAPSQVLGDNPSSKESASLHKKETIVDFGILEDYCEIYGEMEDL